MQVKMKDLERAEEKARIQLSLLGLSPFEGMVQYDNVMCLKDYQELQLNLSSLADFYEREGADNEQQAVLRIKKVARLESLLFGCGLPECFLQVQLLDKIAFLEVTVDPMMGKTWSESEKRLIGELLREFKQEHRISEISFFQQMAPEELAGRMVDFLQEIEEENRENLNFIQKDLAFRVVKIAEHFK